LLEEYRESVLPAVGMLRARLWYIRQVLSFLHIAGLVKAAGYIPAPLLWGAAATLLVYVLVFALPYLTGMALSTILLLFTGIVLTIAGATATRRTLVESWSLIRTGFLGFICFGVTTAVVSSAQVFRPVLLMEMFLVIVTATGVQAACKTGQVRSGILAAVGTGTAVTALVVVTVSVLHLPHPPFASALVLPAAAAILGAIGASFGKRFGRSDADVLISPVNFL
jgi:hypothetical protein